MGGKATCDDTGYIDYKGAIHIHSNYSDGTGTVPDIIKAAKRCELDYIFLTDHDTLGPRIDGWEGYHDDLLVVVGEELSHFKEHCIVLGLDHHVQPRDSIYETMGDVVRSGGLAFIVHPHGKYRIFFRTRRLSWRKWDIEHLTGIEIWSYMFDWVDDFRFYKFKRFYLYPEAQISGPFKETLEMWDQLCLSRRVVGIGGLDVHARQIDPWGKLVVFPYHSMFKTIHTHVLVKGGLTGDFATDSGKLLSELSMGHCFVAYDFAQDSSGFMFRVRGDTAIMGDEVTYSEDLELEVRLPTRAYINVIRNGKKFLSFVGTHSCFHAEGPGVYRIEAYIRKKPWIFSNPIYIREGT